MKTDKNTIEIKRRHRLLKEEFLRLLTRVSKGMQGEMTEAQFETLMSKTVQANKILEGFEKEHGLA